MADLGTLEELTLRSITTPNLHYLAPLSKLWSLQIKLGGIQSFDGIDGKQSIKYLELWQVRGLQEVGLLASLPGLQNVFLQSLPHITSLPSLVSAKSLRRAVLQNMRDLADFSPLEQAPVLEEFSVLQARHQLPEQLRPVLRNPSVRRVSAFFGSEKKNRQFSILRDEYRKAPMEPWQPLEYR